MTTKVFEKGPLCLIYIPVLWRSDEGRMRFGRLFDITMSDMGNKLKYSRFVSITLLGLTIQFRIKKG